MKKWQKMLIPFIAILVIIVILYNTNEGFQNSDSLAAVGFQFTGPLSAFYTALTATGNNRVCGEYSGCTLPTMFSTLMTNPSSVLVPFLQTYPTFKLSVISVTTGAIVYDPISQYANNKTMDPFPNTTNSDTYIFYTNIFNMDITKEQYKTLFPFLPGGSLIVSNCNTLAQRTSTERAILATSANFNNNLLKAVQLRKQSSTPHNPDKTTIDAIEFHNKNHNSQHIIILKNMNYPKTFLDIFLGKYEYTHIVYALIDSAISWNTVVYGPCVSISGFQNMEGFQASFDKTKLYNYKGEQIFNSNSGGGSITTPVPIVVTESQVEAESGPVAAAATAATAATATPAATPPATKEIKTEEKKEEMSNTTITLIALGGVTVIGGGVFLAVRSSKVV